jgi:hypothetical protein
VRIQTRWGTTGVALRRGYTGACRREIASDLRWNCATSQTYFGRSSVYLAQSVPMFNTIYNQRNGHAAVFIGRNPRHRHLPNKFDLNHKFSAPKIGLTFEKTDHIL